MVDWYLAPSLTVFRNEVNTRWPNRDKASDGTIGDESHQAGTSDHNPNSRGSVNAWDMDKDGVNVDEVIAAFMRHPGVNYVIWNRRIADVDTGWRWVDYTGPNPHTQHVHFSIKQNVVAEQNTLPWGLLEEEDMNELQGKQLWATNDRISAALVSGATSHQTDWSSANPNGTESIWITTFLKAMGDRISLLESKLNAIPSLIANVDEATEARLRARFDALDTTLSAMKVLIQEHHDNPGQVTAEEVIRRMGELLSSVN